MKPPLSNSFSSECVDSPGSGCHPRCCDNDLCFRPLQHHVPGLDRWHLPRVIDGPASAEQGSPLSPSQGKSRIPQASWHGVRQGPISIDALALPHYSMATGRDRTTGCIARRYEYEHPRDLVQVNIKTQRRLPDRSGRKILDRPREIGIRQRPRPSGGLTCFLHIAVDDCRTWTSSYLKNCQIPVCSSW